MLIDTVVLMFRYDESDRSAMMKAGLILLTTVALLMAIVLCVTHLINKRTF